MSDSTFNEKTSWHPVLGRWFELTWIPSGLTILTETQPVSTPPKMDVLIIRRNTDKWTEEQLGLLPDGVRDSKAGHIILEFKFTESLTKDAFYQVMSYAYWYRITQKLSHEDVRAFILCAKTPQDARLDGFEYHSTDLAGVYQTDNQWPQEVLVLALNQLNLEVHNAFVKCFASRPIERESAFELLNDRVSGMTRNFLFGLRQLFARWQGDKEMEQVLAPTITEEDVINIGKGWRQSIAESLTLDEVSDRLRQAIVETLSADELSEEVRESLIKTLSADELSEEVRESLIKTLSADELSEEVRESLIKTLSADELSEEMRESLIKTLGLADYLTVLTPEEVLSQFKPEEVLSQFEPEERLGDLPIEVIEEFLRKRREQSQGDVSD
ncbi:MAG: hypothetical protein AAF702_14960 [Chloroflexota bacterium]